MNELYKYLTYTLQVKTTCILDIKDKRDTYMNQKNSIKQYQKYLYLLFMGFIIIVIVINILDTVSFDIILDLAYGKTISLGLRFWLTFFIAAVIFIYSYIKYNKLIKFESDLENKINSANTDIEKLRIEIIDALDGEFCKHEIYCDCRDKYIKNMKVHGINLIFREELKSNYVVPF